MIFVSKIANHQEDVIPDESIPDGSIYSTRVVSKASTNIAIKYQLSGILLATPLCCCRLVGMDPENNVSSHESARAPQSDVDTNLGLQLQRRLLYAANTPSPLHIDDNHVGDPGSRYTPAPSKSAAPKNG